MGHFHQLCNKLLGRVFLFHWISPWYIHMISRWNPMDFLIPLGAPNSKPQHRRPRRPVVRAVRAVRAVTATKPGAVRAREWGWVLNGEMRRVKQLIYLMVISIVFYSIIYGYMVLFCISIFMINVQWIGFREDLQENPHDLHDLHGKITLVSG